MTPTGLRPIGVGNTYILFNESEGAAMAHHSKNPCAVKAPQFPLFRHKSGRWCKKILGRHCYFGSTVSDPEGTAALAIYEAQAEYLHKGLTPPDALGSDGILTLRDAVNRFLTYKTQMVESGELSARTVADYRNSCGRLLDHFGKYRRADSLTAADFQSLRATLARRRNLVSLANEITRLRVLFRWLYDTELIDRPVRFGKSFDRPSKDKLRIERNNKRLEHGLRMFEAHELRTILNAASQPLKAMILLAVNCGFGAADLSRLTLSSVKNDLVCFPRPKTGIERQAYLWPETRAAVEDWLQVRPAPKRPEDVNLLFTTKFGGRWSKVSVNGSPSDPIGGEFNKLLVELELKRPGVSFYALRHTTQTIADEAGDAVITRLLMGHVDPSMGGVYRERINPERVKRVCLHVREWVFGK